MSTNRVEIENKTAEAELAALREQIDALDAQVVELLANRFNLVKQVALVKAAHHLPVLASVRIKKVKDRLGILATSKGLDAEIVKRIYETIHNEALLIEEATITNLHVSWHDPHYRLKCTNKSHSCHRLIHSYDASVT